MGAAWATGDHYLWQELKAWIDSQPSSLSWTVDLFINDYSPVPGDVFANYETPNWGQWPGYFAIALPVTSFGPVQVIDHVAQTVSSTLLQWYRPYGVDPITVFGYVVSASAAFVWAERWETPLVVAPNSTAKIVVQYNLANYPIPSLLNQKRGRKFAAALGQVEANDNDETEG